VPAAAQADSGSITGVRDVGGGQLEATFSASGTECTSYGFCGWYGYANEVASSESCSPSSGGVVWVGDYHDAPGTETRTARFFPSHTPVKLCLVVNGANGQHVVSETVWSPPPPTLIAPIATARLTTRSAVTFLASDAVGAYRESEIEIARSSAMDPDGTLANSEQLEYGTEFSDGAGQFEYESTGAWSRQPGTYYWQLRRSNCETAAACNSEIRRLTIVPPALRLSVAARSRQRLKAGYNNLVMRLKCNLRCRTKMTARPHYRRNGHRVALRGFAFEDAFRLSKGRAVSYGFLFTRRERARLADLMSRYGSILWTLRYQAKSTSGDVDRVTGYIRMLPPARPRPAPPPPSVDCQGYSPCLPPGPDVDCRGGSGDGPRYVDGPVRVYGSDPYDLDRDGNHVGCQ